MNFHFGNEFDTTQSDFVVDLGTHIDLYYSVMPPGKKKGIWITEYITGDRKLSEFDVAIGYLQRFAFAASRGVTKLFIEFYGHLLPPRRGTSDSPDGMPGPIDKSAMVQVDRQGRYKAQLIFYTQKLMNLKLGGFTRCVELTRTHKQYTFTVKGRAVYVLWGGETPPDLAGKLATVTDVFGNIFVVPFPSAGQSIQNVLTAKGGPKIGERYPVFVELPQPGPRA